MGIIGRVASLIRGLRRNNGLQSEKPGSYAAPTPAPVNFDTAMSLSACWSATRLIAETIAALPVDFQRYDDETGRWRPLNTRLSQSPVVGIFNGGKVNRYQTRVEFFETYILNLVMHGNAYALKQYDSRGRLNGLLPLMSQQVKVEILNDGQLVYYYYHDRGVAVYSPDSVWHSKLFGNGVVGLSPLGYARNAMGISLAAENRVARIYKNGGKPTGVLTVDRVLKPDQRAQVKQEFSDLQEGNEDTLMVLEADLKYSPVSMSPSDIQLMESRRFQIEDIARFFGVPSVLINDTSGSTTWGSGIEQIVQGFYKLNLRPYLERLESSIHCHLLTDKERMNMRVEFDFEGLLRANQAERFDAWQKGINAAIFTPNEAREREGLDPIEGGDNLLINGNMMPVQMAGRQMMPGGGSNAA